MSEDDEGRKPPPHELENYEEPEDWDFPTVITEEDDSPEILEDVEPEEAIETLFDNLGIFTIISLVGGILVAVLFYILHHYRPHMSQIYFIIIGFASGLLLVFGASELIILGVKGIQDKLNFNPYFGGILQAIGAALAELVIVIILLIQSYREPIEEVARDLSETAITLILTTVIINILFLGISMIYAARKKPFDLPKELTFYEANLILGLMVFSFVLMIFSFFTEFSIIRSILEGAPVTIYDKVTYNEWFEILIGLASLLVYFIFLMILIRNYGKKTSQPQTLIVEFFPDEDDVIVEEPSTTKFIQTRMALQRKPTADKTDTKPDENALKKPRNGRKTQTERLNALATLRRFPWFIIILVFIFGTGGIIWGGQMLSASIEEGIREYSAQIPILAYAVIVGLVSSSPELIVTFRGLLKKDKEMQEVGLVHQVSAINQTFFILFGAPFVLSGILTLINPNFGIPVTLGITIVMGGIFIMSLAVQLMVMDDNKFDLLEGVMITTLATVSLVALALIGYTSL
jgi:hypothetical protein